MKTDIAIHVFASLQGLEKSFEAVKSQAKKSNPEHVDIVSLLPKQEEILIDMRRTANLLQLQLAKKDWSAAVRSLKIFYGLNKIVRTDIIKAFGITSVEAKKQVRTAFTAAPSKETLYH